MTRLDFKKLVRFIKKNLSKIKIFAYGTGL